MREFATQCNSIYKANINKKKIKSLFCRNYMVWKCKKQNKTKVHLNCRTDEGDWDKTVLVNSGIHTKAQVITRTYTSDSIQQPPLWWSKVYLFLSKQADCLGISQPLGSCFSLSHWQSSHHYHHHLYNQPVQHKTTKVETHNSPQWLWGTYQGLVREKTEGFLFLYE